MAVFYHADHVGNITALLNTNQVVVARYLYEPFGRTIGMSGPWSSRNLYRFSSKEYHEPSGLSYYGRRYYSPDLQRWVNRDPLQERGGINLYGFVANRPVKFVDPLGPYFGGMNGLPGATLPGFNAPDSGGGFGSADSMHGPLDALGLVDPTGVADAANAALYAAQGDFGNAAISCAGMIPFIGDAAKLGRRAIRNAHLENKVHPKTGIPFDKNGFPDFSGVATHTVQVQQTGNRAADFAAANRAAGLDATPRGCTWHHHQDGTTMQLVPTDIHAGTGHTGGVALGSGGN